MKFDPRHNPTRSRRPGSLFIWIRLCLRDRFLKWTPALFLFLPAVAVYADIPAGTEIVNQGTLTYTDQNGVSQQTTTNIVTLVIRQVFSATLESDRSRFGASGKTVVFFHTLKNTGNDVDHYCVGVTDAAGDDGAFSLLSVVWDLNHNGQHDNGELILDTPDSDDYTSLALSPDESAHLLVIGQTPENATSGQVYRAALAVQAREGTGACLSGKVEDLTPGKGFDNTDDTNHDTVTITDNAILMVTKSSEYQLNGAGFNDDTLRYTITVQNSGNQSATDITVSDDLPAHTLYKAGSGATSGAWDTLPGHDGGAPGTVSGGILTLASGDAASFSYTAEIDDTLSGDTEIINIATAQGNLDGAPGLEPLVESNKTIDKTPFIRGVTITDTGTSASPGVNDGGDDDATANDIQRVDGAFQGETVLFSHIVTNTGNQQDTFNLTFAAGNFPSGTLFSFFNSAGTAPLLDTNGDGIVDTGPLDSGSSSAIMVKALLPSKATGSGAFTSVITATSAADWDVLDTTTESLGDIVGFVVDIANSVGAAGFNDSGAANADPPTSAASTVTAAGGETVIFPLFVANEGTGRDGYELSVWADAAASVKLPAGWQAVFKDSQNRVIAHTPGLNKGETFSFFAEISIPKDTPPGTTAVYFKVESEKSAVSDIKQDAVTVAVLNRLALSPDHLGVVTPGTSIEYDHILRNSGNSSQDVIVSVESQSHLNHTLLLPTTVSGTEPSGFQNILSLSPGTSVMIYDKTTSAWKTTSLVSDGASGTALRLAPNERAVIRARVFAPFSVPEAVQDVLTLKAETTDGAVTLRDIDVTTISAAALGIHKTGALDLACDGAPDTSFATGTLRARPGQCVIWRIYLENNGAQTICAIRVYDTAPAFTTLFGAPFIYHEPPPGGGGACAVNAPDFFCAVGNTLDQNNDGTHESFCLKAGEKAEIRFGVKIK
ncbi:Conserved repeat domain protein [Candidatus Desulfarcum epimagneticum]|uniref:Conserved repeat domain protein n=1 Tax=uncultured Desulfobacteraceae bacterium TaxID=218296 RepID=A0A484HJE2_9BACT|nr:Conserved repeat domain protein [uncultured Desulfobacteraceae bacterium]